MKKFLLGTILLGALIVGAPIVGSTLTKTSKLDSNNDLPQIFDRFNVLIKEEPTYVVTSSKDGEKQEPGGYIYYQPAVTESGKELDISYYAGHELKENAILKLDTKGRFVKTWEEVAKEDVPKKVLEKLTVN